MSSSEPVTSGGKLGNVMAVQLIRITHPCGIGKADTIDKSSDHDNFNTKLRTFVSHMIVLWKAGELRSIFRKTNQFGSLGGHFLIPFPVVTSNTSEFEFLKLVYFKCSTDRILELH